MKGTLLFLLLAAISGCGGSTTSTIQQSAVAPTVFVGDSIVGGWDLDSYFPGKGYVNAGWFGKRTDEIFAVLPSILDGSKVCHGFDGTPSDPRFPFSCSSIPKPARVVIFLGWNDMLQAKDTAKAAANISAMVDMAHAANVQVILIIPYRWDSAHLASFMQPFIPCAPDGQYPFSLNQEPVLNAGIKAIPTMPANAVAQLKPPIVDLEALFVCQSDYTTDGLHPNASGYRQMSDALDKVL